MTQLQDGIENRSPTPSDAKLIILRGPSGAGKSTLAKALRSRCKNKKIAILSLDYYRNVLLDNRDQSAIASFQMILENVAIAHHWGFDVIVEGIFDVSHQACVELLEVLVESYQNGVLLYYLAISFDESLRRHQTRPKAKEFGEKHLRQWYGRAQPTGFAIEKMIPETDSLEMTIAKIISDCNW